MTEGRLTSRARIEPDNPTTAPPDRPSRLPWPPGRTGMAGVAGVAGVISAACSMSGSSGLGSPRTCSRDTVVLRSSITTEAVLPEGHTIHRLSRELKRTFGGQVLAASSPQGRFADAAALLDGTALERTDAYGKHLFLGFAARRWLHIHLGLYGKWTVGPRPEPAPRGALRLRLVGVEKYADLRGPTACELVTPAEKLVILARLGPDPLRRGADPAVFHARLSRSRVPVAALLMDQKVVAGIGNVFRAEVLFRQRIAPYAEGRSLRPACVEALWTDLSMLLAAGVRSGRIVTTHPEHRARPSGRARLEDAHYVYRRAGLPCRVCGTKILTDILVGRNLFWCPHCQAG